MIKGVIFDWGGVVIEHNSKTVLEYCAREINVNVNDLASAYKPYDILMQTGEMTEDELWDIICKELGVPARHPG